MLKREKPIANCSRVLQVVALLSLIGSIGCKAGKTDSFAGPAPLTPVSEQEAKVTGELLKEAMGECDYQKLHQLVDLSSIARKGIAATTISDRSKSHFQKKVDDDDQMWRTVCATDAEELTVFKVRPFQKTGPTSVIIKYKGIDENLVYLEFLLGRTETGSIVASDVFIFQIGGLLSQRVTDEVTVLTGDIQKQNAFNVLSLQLRRSPTLGIKELYAASPLLQSSRTLWDFALYASLAEGKEEHLRVRSDYKAKFSGQGGALDFVSVSGMYVSEDWEEVLDALDRIDAQVGGDPELDLYRVYVLIKRKRFAQAEVLAQKYIAQQENSYSMNLALLDVYLDSRAYPAALEVMKYLGEEFELRFPEKLVAQESYPEFATSEEWRLYKEWRDEYFTTNKEPPEEE